MDWFQVAVTAVVTGVAVYVHIEWLRHGGVARRRIALAMMPILILGPSSLIAVDHAWWEMGQILLLVAMPVLFMRLATLMHPMGWPPYAVVAVATGVALGSVLWAGSIEVLGLSLLTAAVVAPYLFAAILLYLGAHERRGVSRRRLNWTALNGLLFAALLLIIVPGDIPLSAPVGRTVAVAVAFSYLMGLATPARIRRAWRAVEFERFVASTRMGAETDVKTRLDAMRRAAASTVEAETAYVLEAQERGVFSIAQDRPFPTEHGLAKRLLEAALAGQQRLDDWAMIGLEAPGQPHRAMVIALRPDRLFPEEDDAMLVTMAEEVRNQFLQAAAREAQQHARSTAEELLRFRSQYLRAVGHELANPLTPLLMEISILRRRHGDESGRHIDRMARSVERVRALATDISTVAHLSAARLRLDVEPTDLRDLLTEVYDAHAEASKKQGCALHIDAPRAVTLPADTGRLRQVLDNLVNNAIKYSPEGGLVQGRLYHDDKWAVLHIRDEGLGMDQDQMERLFRTYGRVHLEVAPGIRGTGMGLYIARQLVRIHGGELEVQSPGPGKGSTFTLRLPLEGPPKESTQVDQDAADLGMPEA